jgi:CubicO group peptidase (beta-lactamase class C family)
MTTLRFLLCFLLLHFAGASHADVQAELNDLLKQVPSFSGIVEVRRGSEILASAARGYANRETQTPWSSQSQSTVGSITKQFTAAAVMKLVEQGYVTTDSTLGETIPELKSSNFSEVTVHQLLTHSAGIPDVMLPDNTPFSRDDVIAHVGQAQPMFAPGSKYAYSNMGYSVLAAIIELSTGEAFNDYLTRELFAPAGIAVNTGYDVSIRGSDLVQAYRKDDSRVGTMIDDIYIDKRPSWLLLGNGGMYSSNDALHRWCMALHAGEVIEKNLVAEMWQPQIDETNGEGASFYGYGWVVFHSDRLGPIVAHNGDDAFSTLFSDFICVPESGLSLILRSNSLDYDQNVAAVVPGLWSVVSKTLSPALTTP